MRRLCPLALASLLALIASGCASDSIRLATYNAYLLSPVFRCANATVDCIVQNEGKSEAWAEQLANTILANKDTVDVVALNEVWDEDARAILAARLAQDYPVQIRKVSKNLVDLDLSGVAAPIRPRMFGEDSGLMLFAKSNFAVVPLLDPANRWEGDGITSVLESLDATTPEVAFNYYRHCNSVDCLASKGAALVRLRHRGGLITYNIVFTHMQADPQGEFGKYADARRGQFEEVRRLLLKNFPDLTTRVAGTEAVVLLGDLNVPFKNGGPEWASLFANPSSFYATTMSETWIATSSPADTTATNLLDRERLDYIVMGGPPLTPIASPPVMTAFGRRPCVQHLTVPDAFVREPSDHSMVLADINLGFWHCSPRLALTVDTRFDIVQSPAGAGDTVRINKPGAMQWFFVPDPDVGTYSIGTDQSARLAVDVFLPNNMTTPVSRYNITPGKGLPPRGVHRGKFKTDLYAIKGPFFIRVSGTTRTVTTDYTLAVRKHHCESRETACLLRPADPHPATLSKAGTLNPQNEAWFRFDLTGTPTVGQQTVRLVAELADVSVAGDLIDYVDPSGSPPLTTSLDPTPPVRRWSGPATAGASGYIRIQQSQLGSVDRAVSALLDTSLRFLKVRDLICTDETNPEAGSDDIYSKLTIDNVERRVPASGEREFDCDDSSDPHDWGKEIGIPTIAFNDKVHLRIYEEDDSSDDDLSRLRELLPPAPGTDVRDKDPAIWNFDGGRYELWYESRRRENTFVADP